MGPRLRHRLRLAIATAVLLAVASPVVTGDAFPLSTYPIYASDRADVASLGTAVGIDGAGRRVRLGLRTIGRTDDPLVAESLVHRAIASGRARQLCEEIAARAPARLAAVEVVVERHDLVARATGERSLVGRRRHARCPAR